MKVSDLGEFGLIDRLASMVSPAADLETARRLAVGIGDDAAVWCAGDRAIIATTDTLVAGTHFIADAGRWSDVGWKAIAVNVSDVAAMGGTPEFALVTLGLTQDERVDAIDEVYAGMNEACEALGVAIAGGDIVRSPVFFVSVALNGRAQLDGEGRPQVLCRAAAEAGDLIGVTGTLGGSAAGLCLLRQGRNNNEVARALVERHLRPQPRVDVGRAALDAGIRCAIDISDGLLQDLGHICKASGVSASVWADKLPVDAGVRRLFADEGTGLAASGGEDYELLMTGDGEQIERLAQMVDLPVTVIGEMVIASEHEAKLLDEAGNEIELQSTGWDHLSDDRS